MIPSKELREDFKDSKRDQAARATGFLERVGYRVRKENGEIASPELSTAEVEEMSEMEHGRWVVERLQSGWRYGPNRDPSRKISPYLVGWDQLPDHVKEYDREVVRNWPAILRRAGLEMAR